MNDPTAGPHFVKRSCAVAPRRIRFGRSLISICLFLGFYALGSTRPAAEGYLWPTDASRLPSSSFGEFRSNHIHAGIDIKTWGTEGWRVYAVDTGSVVRIEVSPYGYGRSLQIRLKDGRKALYAHLSRFADPIEAIVRLEQKRVGRFAVGLDFNPGFLPVDRGQVVAYTGSTGAGGPHLHFEMWDLDGSAVNPLSFGYSIQDHIPPLLQSVAFTPLSAGSHIEGGFESLTFPLRRIIKGMYRLQSPVRTWGDVGLAVSSSDKADGAGNLICPSEMRLYVDEALVFSSRYERFDQTAARQVHLDRDFHLRVAGRGLFQKLYVDRGNTLPFYDPPGAGSGVLRCLDDAADPDNGHAVADADSMSTRFHAVDAGEHLLRLEVLDYAGNLSLATGRLLMIPLDRVIPAVHFPGPAWAGGIPGRIKAPQATVEKKFVDDRLCFSVRFDAPVADLPRLAVRLNGWSETLVTLVAKSQSSFLGVMPLDESVAGTMVTELRYASETGAVRTVSDTVQVFGATPEYGGALVSADGLCRIVVPPGSLYKPLWGIVRSEPATARAFGLGRTYRVEPSGVPLREKIQVVFDLGGCYGRDTRMAVYAMKPAGRPSFLGGFWENGTLCAWSYQFHPYTCLIDTIPPALTVLGPLPNGRFKTRQSQIRLRIGDSLSGVQTEDQYEAFLDGEKLVLEFVPERSLAFQPFDATIAPGPHWLEVRVRDRVGNETVHRRRFNVN
jgi:hypothetical protein